MTRRLNSAGTSSFEFNIGALAGYTASAFTSVILFKKVSDALFEGLINVTDSGHANADSYFNQEITDTTNCPTWIGADCTGQTLVIADGWIMLVVTRAAGAAGVAYVHRQTSAAWTQATFDAAGTNGIAWPANGILQVGRWDSSDQANIHVASVALYDRIMDVGEIQRLRSGRLDRWNPIVLAEFPPGNRYPLAWCRDSGRYGMKMSAVNTNAISPETGPPGFQFSRFSRRR